MILHDRATVEGDAVADLDQGEFGENRLAAMWKSRPIRQPSSRRSGAANRAPKKRTSIGAITDP
jgi:hypothetical protein